MSAAPSENSDGKPQPPEKSTVVLLFSIAADTTWRMFVPTLGTFLGLWAESQWHFAPWGGIGGLAIGIVITALLVRQQYKKANESDVK